MELFCSIDEDKLEGMTALDELEYPSLLTV